MTVRGVEQVVGGLGRFFVPFLIGVIAVVVIIAILDRFPRNRGGKSTGGSDGIGAAPPMDVGEQGNQKDQR